MGGSVILSLTPLKSSGSNSASTDRQTARQLCSALGSVYVAAGLVCNAPYALGDIRPNAGFENPPPVLMWTNCQGLPGAS
jgi:hypothetical protein